MRTECPLCGMELKSDVEIEDPKSTVTFEWEILKMATARHLETCHGKPTTSSVVRPPRRQEPKIDL